MRRVERKILRSKRAFFRLDFFNIKTLSCTNRGPAQLIISLNKESPHYTPYHLHLYPYYEHTHKYPFLLIQENKVK